MSVKIKRFLLLALLVAFISLAGTVPLQQSIDCVCAVEPADVWYFMRDGGQISTGWEKKLLGTISPRTLLQLEPNDIVELDLLVSNGSVVSAGDTVATVKSHEQTGQLLELKAELAEVSAEHNALLAGERIEDQEIARQRLLRSKATLEAYLPEYERTKELFESGVLPLTDWQKEQRQYRLYVADVEVDQAQYEASKVGARSEDVLIVDAEIKRLQQKIDNASRSLTRMETVVTPLGGIVRLGDLDGIIMRIERTDTMAVAVVIPEVIAGLYNSNRPIEIHLSAKRNEILTGKISQLNYFSIDPVNAYGILFLENRYEDLENGMSGIAKLPLGELTLWEGIKIKLQGLQKL